MASFLKTLSSLFGGGRSADGGGADKAETAGKAEEYKGFTIRPTPFKDGGQYQTCGVVEKTIGDELKSHRYIRADRFAGLDEANDFALTKGRQLVDEQGDRLFAQ